MKLEFLKLKKENIFCDDFNRLSRNNIIDFDESKINILYAPNGVGKSTFCKTLKGDGEFELNYNGISYDNTNCNIFHIISDQNSRNIIEGDAKDFLLGDNIVKEFDLREWLNQKFLDIFNTLKGSYKDKLNIAKKTDKKIEWLDKDSVELVQRITKNGSKPADIDLDDYLSYISSLEQVEIGEYEEEKLEYIKNDSNTELINELLNIRDITGNEKFSKIEQCDDAVLILNKYHDLTNCIVCDNENINADDLISSKKQQKDVIINGLDIRDKNILDRIINRISDDDVFDIKHTLTNAIVTGSIQEVNDLLATINYYKTVFSKISNNILKNSIPIEFIEKYNEYKIMLSNELNFSDEDLLFIEKFIADNIGKEIKLCRKDKKIAITLNSEDFLGVERQNLKLSSGEQNFISLTFELLKARNMQQEIVVIDDPISSFDSIFKNKLVFSIIKFLENKNVIILTHNIDLVRLIEYQKKGNYELYIFNNYEGQENGFINISNNEKNIMISIPELLNFIRGDQIDNDIKDERMFLYSLIPFMRGYANFIGDCGSKNLLNNLMHGYKTEIVDLTAIYNSFFSKKNNNNYSISVSDLLSTDINTIPVIIDNEKYPLLNRVLSNNFVYLFLRLKTEKTLVDKYVINTNHKDQLASIIYEAFKTDTPDNIKMKVFFFSKKTLLTEFNHFDGNMNIFQPAIDISEKILNKEKSEIIDMLNSLL